MTATPRLVDPTVPLPADGLHMIEASAGTGKTWTLSSLAVRYIAEVGVDAREILLVTFTIEAAAELRHRVRERLTALLRALRDGDIRAGDDHELIDALRTRHDVGVVVQRITAALRDFDQATISTIHAFSQQVLVRSGLESDPDMRLRADLSTVATDVVADQLAERSLRAEDNADLPSVAEVATGLLQARNRPDARVLPDAGSERVRELHRLLDMLNRWDGQPDQLDSPEALDALAIWDAHGGGQTLMSNKTSKDPRTKVEPLLSDLLRFAKAAELVRSGRAELSARLERQGELGFADLLTRAAELITAVPDVRHELQRRFRVVFIDEFQDTDPVQWKLLTALLQPPALTDLTAPVMVVVGDPKQAIYRFRGGDVGTYLRAREQVDRQVHALTTNHRSTPELIAALNELFAGTSFGPGIGYTPVSPPEVATDAAGGVVAADGAAGVATGAGRDAGDDGAQPTLPFADGELASEPVDPPMRVRMVPCDGSVDKIRRLIARDLADQVVEATSGPAVGNGSSRALRYSDVAVLYTAHAHGPAILQALRERGIPAVITKGESVLDTHAVTQWQTLLWALARPTDPSRARAAALTPFFGAEPQDVLDDEFLRRLQGRLRVLAAALQEQGIAHVSRLVMRDWRGAEHFARREHGDRDLVDVEHIGELLHLATEGVGVSATAASDLLEELVFADPDDVDYAADLTKRRLETEVEQDVVRIMSIHASKGLEFPMVCCPTLWTAPTVTSPIQYRGADGQVLHFMKKGLDPESWEQADTEAVEEATRLAYVALTRAIDRVVVWWPDDVDGTPKQGSRSGLARLLLTGAHATTALAGTAPSAFRSLADQHPDAFAVSFVGPGAGGTIDGDRGEGDGDGSRGDGSRGDRGDRGGGRSSADAAAGGWTAETATGDDELRCAELARQLDRSRGRLSFSAITGVAFPYEDRLHQASSDPELDDDAGSLDENPDEILDRIDPVTVAEVDLAVLPLGKDAGTRLHSVFEDLDFAVTDDQLDRDLGAALGERFRLLDVEGTARAHRGIRQALATPLGLDGSAFSLRDIARADRLDEMQFDLPLRSGDSAATLVRLSEVLLAGLPAGTDTDRAIREWAASLANPKRVVRLGGFLTGSIDLLFRHSVDGAVRHVVADYKSNKVARWPEPMTTDVYTPPRLLEEMVHGQYLLQALLYLVATHRFLGQRIDGYDPDVHLGPALYLFVRGMTGDHAPDGQPHGVFSWRPPTALIVTVDNLLLAEGTR